MLVVETNEIDEVQKEKYITLKQGDNIFGRDKQEADFIIKVFGTQLCKLPVNLRLKSIYPHKYWIFCENIDEPVVVNTH